MGINGKETTVLTDVYKWDLGWKENQNNVCITSVEIPDEFFNIKGMLLGRDTVYKKCWELAYETLQNGLIGPYVPTTQGPVHLVSSTGE